MYFTVQNNVYTVRFSPSLLLRIATGSRSTSDGGREVILKYIVTLSTRIVTRERRPETHLHGADGGLQVRTTDGDSLLDIPLSFVDRSLGLQTRVALEVIERLGRLGGLIGCAGSEVLVRQPKINITKRQ